MCAQVCVCMCVRARVCALTHACVVVCVHAPASTLISSSLLTMAELLGISHWPHLGLSVFRLSLCSLKA